MSLTLLHNSNNELYMSADYRRSIEINGTQFAFSDDSIKMIHNKKYIVFGAGKETCYSELFKRLVAINDFTIDDIIAEAKDIIPTVKEYDPDKLVSLTIVVGAVEDGQPCYYEIFETRGFKPTRTVLKEGEFKYIGAITEPKHVVDQWFASYGDSYKIENIFKDFYTRFQNEGIGGYFSLDGIDNVGVFEVAQKEIPLKKEIRWVRFVNENTVDIYTRDAEYTLDVNELIVNSHQNILGNIYARNLDDYGITSRKIDNEAVTPSKLDRTYAEYGEFKELKSDVATIERLYVTEARVKDLVADKASISQLNAANARINNLNASVADIKNLTAGLAYIDITKSGTLSAKGIYSSGTLSGGSLFVDGEKYERKYLKDLDMYVLASRN